MDVGAAGAVLAAADGRLGPARRSCAADGRTRLDVLHQAGAARVRFPKPAAGAPPEAVLLNTAGGLTGGDRIDIERGAWRPAPRRPSPRRRPRRSTARATARPTSRVRLDAGGRRPPRLAAAADHPVRPAAARPPHRGRACRRRQLPRRRDADLRPRGHGRGRASRRLPRRLARPARRRAGVRRHVPRSMAPSPLRWTGRPRSTGARAVAMLIYAAADAAAGSTRRARCSSGRGSMAGASAWNGLLVVRAMAPRRPHAAGRRGRARAHAERPAAAARVAMLRRWTACRGRRA